LESGQIGTKDDEVCVLFRRNAETMYVPFSEFPPGTPTLPSCIGKSRSQEMALAGSVFHKTPLPLCVVRFSNGQDIVGHGAYYQLGQRHFIATAIHVMAALSKLHECFIVGPSGLSVAFPLPKCSGQVRTDKKHDTTLVNIEQKYVSKVGLRPAKVAKVFKSNQVHMHYDLGQNPGKTSGKVLEQLTPLMYSHSCSTDYGCSGAPVMIGTSIAGIHIGRDEHAGVNHFIRLDALLPRSQETSDYAFSEMRSTSEFMDEDYSVVDIYGDKVKKTIKYNANYFYAEDPEEFMRDNEEWFNMQDEMDWSVEPSFESLQNVFPTTTSAVVQARGEEPIIHTVNSVVPKADFPSEAVSQGTSSKGTTPGRVINGKKVTISTSTVDLFPVEESKLSSLKARKRKKASGSPKLGPNGPASTSSSGQKEETVQREPASSSKSTDLSNLVWELAKEMRSLQTSVANIQKQVPQVVSTSVVVPSGKS
jgi:hypothetical protein